MLLTVDIGNSYIKLGAYPARCPDSAAVVDGTRDDDAPLASWRLATDRHRRLESYRHELDLLWEESEFSRTSFQGAALCSVVETLTSLWRNLLTEMLGREPFVLRHGIDTGMPLAVAQPERVGMDRLADAVAVRGRSAGAAVVVDFGTATTFNVVDAHGRFRGGAIAPGLGTMAGSLMEGTPSLPNVELRPPVSAIGEDTEEALKSGIVLGFTGLVEGLLARIGNEIDAPVTVIATGGLGHIISPLTSSIDAYDPWLTLAGIRALYCRNATKADE
ncbi:MAG: type III pantothenate kinase [Caldilineaceae bacterium]|nr:type III pantothenate kinase [Caldilineaceae bacterium]